MLSSSCLVSGVSEKQLEGGKEPSTEGVCFCLGDGSCVSIHHGMEWHSLPRWIYMAQRLILFCKYKSLIFIGTPRIDPSLRIMLIVIKLMRLIYKTITSNFLLPW